MMKEVETLQAEGFEAATLDELVQDVASSMASDINNGGMEDQVAFLMEQGLTIDEIMAKATEIMI
jgi:hypothetical protein